MLIERFHLWFIFDSVTEEDTSHDCFPCVEPFKLTWTVGGPLLLVFIPVATSQIRSTQDCFHTSSRGTLQAESFLQISPGVIIRHCQLKGTVPCHHRI